MKKRGQVAIFIIVGIILIVGIIAVFLIFEGEAETSAPAALSPGDFVQDCVRDVVDDLVGILLNNGGEVNMQKTIKYLGEDYNYLCYQEDYYSGCYNIHPMLRAQIEGEIEIDTRDKVVECFDAMRGNFEDLGFVVSGETTDYSIEIMPGYIEINLRKPIYISKDGTSQSFENFDTRLVSPLYSLIEIARDIVNSESQFCHFEYNGYMLLFPKYDIKRVSYDESKLYRVTDRQSGNEFKFAVRSCALAPGI